MTLDEMLLETEALKHSMVGELYTMCELHQHMLEQWEDKLGLEELKELHMKFITWLKAEVT